MAAESEIAHVTGGQEDSAQHGQDPLPRLPGHFMAQEGGEKEDGESPDGPARDPAVPVLAASETGGQGRRREGGPQHPVMKGLTDKKTPGQDGKGDEENRRQQTMDAAGTGQGDGQAVATALQPNGSHLSFHKGGKSGHDHLHCPI